MASGQILHKLRNLYSKASAAVNDWNELQVPALTSAFDEPVCNKAIEEVSSLVVQEASLSLLKSTTNVINRLPV